MGQRCFRGNFCAALDSEPDSLVPSGFDLDAGYDICLVFIEIPYGEMRCSYLSGQ